VQHCPPQIPHDDLGLNPGRRGRKPTNNRLSYGKAFGHWLENQAAHKENFVSNEFDLNAICLRKFVSRVSSFHQR
jgi:hypothetical protein